VRVTHVVTKENVSDMDNMVQICVDLGVDEAAFLVMGELPETKHLQLEENEVETVRNGIESWGRDLDRAGIAHTLPIFANDLAMRAKHGEVQHNPLQRRLPCYVGWMFCVIGPDGVVLPCCYCEQTELGNINERSFVDIWNGELYKNFRRACLGIPKSGRWICEECFTSCNRYIENRFIYNKIHPFQKIS
jgi:radical SAM protein with 4Fe4S-binding SPASM domain